MATMQSLFRKRKRHTRSIIWCETKWKNCWRSRPMLIWFWALSRKKSKGKSHRNGDGKKKRPQDAQPHQRCVMGDLGFSPTSRSRTVFSSEKIARFAERVPHGIACNSLVSFCSQLCFDRCRFVINKNFSKNNSSFPVRQKGSSATVLWKHGKAGCGIGNLSYKPKTSV